MGLLSEEELTEIRQEFTSTLDKTATVQRRTLGTNTAGSKPRTYTDVSEVACRVQDRIGPSKENTSEGRETGDVPFTIIFPWNADIRTTDRLAIDGKTFEVKGTAPVRSERFTNTVEAVLVV